MVFINIYTILWHFSQPYIFFYFFFFSSIGINSKLKIILVEQIS